MAKTKKKKSTQKKRRKSSKKKKREVRYVVTFNRYGRKGTGRAILGGRGKGVIGEHNSWKTKREARKALEEWFFPHGKPVVYGRGKSRHRGNWNPRIKKVIVER